jgi:hypothetical protein
LAIVQETAVSVLVVNIIPEGIIFGADRLSRWGPDHEGRIGYTEGFKVLRWSNRRALIGFVGMADLGRRSERNSTFEWLSDFVGEYHNFDSLRDLAHELNAAVHNQYRDDGWTDSDADLLIIELAGFERHGNVLLPEVWHIANAHGINPNTGSYEGIDSSFGVSEECLSKYTEAQHTDFRRVLRQRPFWIHQTGDLGMFNSLCAGLDLFYDARLNMFGHDPVADPPALDALLEFESRVRMKVLSYGAFNDAFETPVARAVGGGCDVLSLEWPEVV